MDAENLSLSQSKIGNYDNLSLAKHWNESLTVQGRYYLNHRGINDESISKYLLGQVVLGEKSGYSRFAGRFSIPYLNPDGTVRGFRFRANGSLAPKYDAPKYDSLSGTRASLFGVYHTTEKRVGICEGEYDSIILTQLGLPSVGVPGANTFRSEWKYLFRYAFEVSIIFDGDKAGRDGALRIASILGDQIDNLRLIWLDNKKDVTDMYLEDPSRLQELIK